DPQLGPLDLGVQVSSRVAVLWGPVPSRELAYRAEQRLRTLYDLVEVRNRLTIDSDGAAPWALPHPDPPRFLPDEVPPLSPKEPRPPVLQRDKGVALAGIVIADEAFTAR